MSNARLPCEQSPLSWPSSVDINELRTCDICAISLVAPFAGPLEVVSRNTGTGVGDGVSIKEHPSITLYYKNQQYSIEEAIFHTPGLHTFPGQTAIYPAEYHIHMKSVSAPIRYITLVVPISHRVPENTVTAAYFTAMKKSNNPTKQNPTLESLITAVNSDVLQYLGSDLRGRIYANRDMSGCNTKREERQFLLVTKPAYINAIDLERIPREGSVYINGVWTPPLPVVDGIRPTKLSLRDEIMRRVVLATPGFAPQTKAIPVQESRRAGIDASGKPLKLVRGNDLIDVSGRPITLQKLLGNLNKGTVSDEELPVDPSELNSVMIILCTLVNAVGFLLADYVISSWLWPLYFTATSNALSNWSIYKWFLFMFVCFMPLIYYLYIKLNTL